MQITWTNEAIDTLSEIEFSIAQDSPNRAREFRKFLKQKSKLISQNPFIGRIVPEFLDSNIRELIIKNYRLVYHVKNNKIEILTVMEGHRLLNIDKIEE
jgi:addiction module RelE/StbE family toxin